MFVELQCSTIVGIIIVVIAVRGGSGSRFGRGWLCSSWLWSCRSPRRSGGRTRALAAWDQVLDPGKETLDSNVDSRSGRGTSWAVAHHSHQRVLAWRLNCRFIVKLPSCLDTHLRGKMKVQKDVWQKHGYKLSTVLRHSKRTTAVSLASVSVLCKSAQLDLWAEKNWDLRWD